MTDDERAQQMAGQRWPFLTDRDRSIWIMAARCERVERECTHLRALLDEAQSCMWQHHNSRYHGPMATSMFSYGGDCAVCAGHPGIFHRIAAAVGDDRAPRTSAP